MKHLTTWLLVALMFALLTGCAGSPAHIARMDQTELLRVSDAQLCTTYLHPWQGGTLNVENEIKRRGLDCRPWAPVASAGYAASERMMGLGLDLMRQRDPYYGRSLGTTTQCRAIGEWVYCDTW